MWLNGTNATKLVAQSDPCHKLNGALAPIKSISDTLIYHPVKYKVLFGTNADSSLQATFKVVKNPDQVTNDADIKSRVIDAINLFFSLDNWEFGDTFYFTELSTFVMNQLAPDVSTFVIVPNAGSQTFGSLYEIRSENDEIFISGAKVTDVQIIDAITASNLRSSGSIVTSTSTDTGLSGTMTLGSASTSRLDPWSSHPLIDIRTETDQRIIGGSVEEADINGIRQRSTGISPNWSTRTTDNAEFLP